MTSAADDQQWQKVKAREQARLRIPKKIRLGWETEISKGGVKHDAGKPRHDLIDAEAMTELAKVLTFGAQKYEEENWRKGISFKRLIAAAERHIAEIKKCEDSDEETGLQHAAHAMCCMMFLSWMQRHRKDMDDRYRSDAQMEKENPRRIVAFDLAQEEKSDTVDAFTYLASGLKSKEWFGAPRGPMAPAEYAAVASLKANGKLEQTGAVGLSLSRIQELTDWLEGKEIEGCAVYLAPVHTHEWDFVETLAKSAEFKAVPIPSKITQERASELVTWHKHQLRLRGDRVNAGFKATATDLGRLLHPNGREAESDRLDDIAAAVTLEEVKALLATPVTPENLQPGVWVKLKDNMFDLKWCVLGCVEQSNPVYHLARINEVGRTECRDVFIADIAEIIS